MIVLIPRDHIEHHTPELLLNRGHPKSKPTDQLQQLLVAIRAGEPEVVVCDGAERLHVELVSIGGAIKAARHEMPSAVLLE